MRSWTDEELQKISEISSRFMDSANAGRRGYCKEWKAHGIVMSMTDIAAVTNTIDSTRIVDYVNSCLRMEGFNKNDCNFLGAWLFVELLTFFRSDYLKVMYERIATNAAR